MHWHEGELWAAGHSDVLFCQHSIITLICQHLNILCSQRHLNICFFWNVGGSGNTWSIFNGMYAGRCLPSRLQEKSWFASFAYFYGINTMPLLISSYQGDLLYWHWEVVHSLLSQTSIVPAYHCLYYSSTKLAEVTSCPF